MRKIMKVFLVMLLAVTLTACSCERKANKPNDNNNKDPKTEEPLKDVTKKKQGKIEFEDIKIEYQGAMNIVTAKVINNSSKTVSFKAVLYMKNSDKRTLGKVDQTIKDLKSGGTTNINVEIMGDYRTVETFEVVIEDLVES